MKKVSVEAAIRLYGGPGKDMVVISFILLAVVAWGIGCFIHQLFTDDQGNMYTRFFLAGLSLWLFTKWWRVPFDLIRKRNAIIAQVEEDILLENCLIEAGLRGEEKEKMKLE